MDPEQSAPAGELERPDVVETLAQRIAHARRSMTTTSMLEPGLYPRWHEIYAVHDRVHELLGRQAVGWKIGAASEEIRRAEHMPEPISGRIYTDGLHRNGALLGRGLFIGFRLCECEFVLTLGADLPPGREPLDRDTLTRAIATVRAGLEVGDMVWDDWYGTGPFWGACLDNAGGSQLVLGPEHTYTADMDLSSHRIELYCNGMLVKTGDGSAALGDPLEAALWIVNLRRSRGDHIAEGTLLSTGTCTGHFFASAGDHVTADFGSLGRVGAQFGTGS